MTHIYTAFIQLDSRLNYEAIVHWIRRTAGKIGKPPLLEHNKCQLEIYVLLSSPVKRILIKLIKTNTGKF